MECDGIRQGWRERVIKRKKIIMKAQKGDDETMFEVDRTCCEKDA